MRDKTRLAVSLTCRMVETQHCTNVSLDEDPVVYKGRRG